MGGGGPCECAASLNNCVIERMKEGKTLMVECSLAEKRKGILKGTKKIKYGEKKFKTHENALRGGVLQSTKSLSSIIVLCLKGGGNGGARGGGHSRLALLFSPSVRFNLRLGFFRE